MGTQYDRIFQTAMLCSSIACEKALAFRHEKHLQTRKSDKSWVTEADRQIEDEMRKLILAHHPGHFILGEEEGGQFSCHDNDYAWVLDPIDGTFSFVHNVPFYSSLIAVFKGGIPVIGVASLPALGITLSAIRGEGVFINGQRYVRPDLVGSAAIEIVATADVYRFYLEQKQGVLETLYGPEKKSRTYPDALGYYLLLQGSVRAFVDPKVELWDVAPFHVILPEAGFAIQNWDGEAKAKKGTSVAYALDSQGKPQNCRDILELTAKFA